VYSLLQPRVLDTLLRNLQALSIAALQRCPSYFAEC
jgi:hypothetical protein